MDLAIIWFFLIVVLFTGFFILEGFDYGVGTLMPFLDKEDSGRRLIINTIGPFWDGNEVWLITAGGAIFAAFPHWYATMFSSFYIPFVILLLVLIIRIVSFEFRSKHDSPFWRMCWDWGIFSGSAVPAVIWGIAVANLIKGIPIGPNKIYAGSVSDLLHGYTVLGGWTFLALFIYHGSLFLSLKIGDDILEKVKKISKIWGFIALASLLIFILATVWVTSLEKNFTIFKAILPGLSLIALLISTITTNKARYGLSFALTCFSILFLTFGAFMFLYPNVMISSLGSEYHLTIKNSSSSDYTLGIMSWVALIFVPIVLAYQGWTYWVFRKRLTRKSPVEY